MAINPAALYPGQISTTADPVGYPYGKPQNVVVAGDGSGTPWEASVASDIFGFLQACLNEDSITPSGTPDKVGASQYLAGIKAAATVIAAAAAAPKVTAASACYEISGSGYGVGDTCALTAEFASAGFVLDTDTVEVPAAGRYLVSLVASINSSSTNNPAELTLDVRLGGSRIFMATAIRFSALASQDMSVGGSAVVDITTPSTQLIQVRSFSLGNLELNPDSVSRLSIARVG